MPVLTSSATITVGAGVAVTESVSLAILPALGAATGNGRLIHPTLGVYDYLQSPKEWIGIDGDVLIPPIWASSKTLLGSANTLWQGNIRDVLCEEHWTGQLTSSAEHLRMLLSFWQNPPDPALAYVLWYPNYTTALGFKVLLTELTVGGQGITLNKILRQGWNNGQIVLKLKIAGRV